MRKRLLALATGVMIVALFAGNASAHGSHRAGVYADCANYLLPGCHRDPASRVHGTLVHLEGTLHLWITDAQGVLHWGGDTRALAGKHVSWGDHTTVNVEQLRALPVGDPWLSAGLLKDGDPIYLVKWETHWAQPRLLHIQSIADVELFGINENNYGEFVLDRAAWETRYGISVDDLQRDALPPATGPVGPSAPAPTPTPTPHPQQHEVYLKALERGAPEELARQIAAQVVASGRVREFLMGLDPITEYGSVPIVVTGHGETHSREFDLITGNYTATVQWNNNYWTGAFSGRRYTGNFFAYLYSLSSGEEIILVIDHAVSGNQRKPFWVDGDHRVYVNIDGAESRANWTVTIVRVS